MVDGADGVGDFGMIEDEACGPRGVERVSGGCLGGGVGEEGCCTRSLSIESMERQRQTEADGCFSSGEEKTER